MNKILADGTILTKARFTRTTCKQCRKEMPKSIIMSGGNFCNKLCRRDWNNKKHIPKRLFATSEFDPDEEHSHCDMSTIRDYV